MVIFMKQSFPRCTLTNTHVRRHSTDHPFRNSAKVKISDPWESHSWEICKRLPVSGDWSTLWDLFSGSDSWAKKTPIS